VSASSLEEALWKIDELERNPALREQVLLPHDRRTSGIVSEVDAVSLYKSGWFASDRF
jgi:hypothetical protein